jgi:signal transduction histidine kinase
MDIASALAAATRCAASQDRGALSSGGRPAAKVTTGRRLFLALSALVCMLFVAVLLVSSGLSEIESTLERMEQGDERMRIALELESEARDQYAHGIRIAMGESAQSVDYLAAQASAQELLRRLAKLVQDPEEAAWVADLESASGELQRAIDVQIASARTARRQPSDLVAPDLEYPIQLAIEERVNAIVAREHENTVRLRSEMSALEESLFRRMLAFFVGALLFAAAVFWYIHRSVSRPVARLGEGAARLARGELETRIDIESDDEFGALAAQFNWMTESLKRHQEQHVRNEKLASVGRLAAGVAHELNNPLSVILGYLMLHRRKATGRLAKDLWLVEQEAVRCKEIVQDLLDLSRPGHVIEPVEVDMRDLCEEVVAGLTESGQLAQVRATVEGAGTALGARSKLRQVLVNLIRNAAEAAGAGGRVRVRVSSSAKDVEVAVSDSGPGISPPERRRIFEPFFTTKSSGTGLGLAVSRAIARAHGGDITVAEEEGGGALFALCVPRRAERSA